ncbi:MAG: FliG C-terminal domain-containing protein [Hyphomicrobium sp.]
MSTVRRTLSGPEKVGLLLLALGKQRADAFLKRLDGDELNTIMRSTEAMPTINTPQLENIVEEFSRRLAQGLPFVGSGEEVKRLVNGAIAENRAAASGSGEIEESQDVWTQMGAVADDILSAFLTKQHPQVAAYLLHRLGPDRAAVLLRFFAPAQRNAIISRMLGLRDVLPVTIDALEQSIRHELFDADNGASDKYVAIASILNNFDKADSADSLSYLFGIRPRDAEAIRKLLFKFEDLMKLSPKALTVLMDGVPVERVVIALQGTDTGFQQTILAALSPRARRMAEAELQSGATASPRDLADSRRTIVDAVLKLVAEGGIDLTSSAPVD